MPKATVVPGICSPRENFEPLAASTGYGIDYSEQATYTGKRPPFESVVMEDMRYTDEVVQSIRKGAPDAVWAFSRGCLIALLAYKQLQPQEQPPLLLLSPPLRNPKETPRMSDRTLPTGHPIEGFLANVAHTMSDSAFAAFAQRNVELFGNQFGIIKQHMKQLPVEATRLPEHLAGLLSHIHAKVDIVFGTKDPLYLPGKADSLLQNEKIAIHFTPGDHYCFMEYAKEIAYKLGIDA